MVKPKRGMQNRRGRENKLTGRMRPVIMKKILLILYHRIEKIVRAFRNWP